MTLPLGVKEDRWLADILGKPAYELAIDDAFVTRATAPDDALARWLAALAARPCFAFAKVPTAAVRLAHFLEDRGFRLVDTNCTFDKAVDPAAWSEALARDFVVRLATAADRDAAIALARESFRYSRAHLDPSIPAARADETRARWVESFFLGQRGDQLVLATSGAEVVGFLLLLRPAPDTFVIDLIAVGARQRRRGIARALCAFAERHYADCRQVLVGTQVANVPSIRLYEAMGFRLASSKYVLHLHGSHG
jgi:ribosomal protein S18 acetylase RimI-like enzyme